jgi:hypothetical protein
MSLETDLAAQIWELTQKKAEIKDAEKKINEKMKSLQAELIELLMEEGKNSTGHIDGVGTFTLARTIYPSVRAGDMPRFIDSLRGTDDFGMVKEVIPAPTLKRYLKDRIEEMREDFLDSPDLIPEGKTVDQLVMSVLGGRGVTMFDEVAIRHTKKGK